MFEFEVVEKRHFTSKEGEESFRNWKAANNISVDNFDFRIDAGRTDRRGFKVYWNVVSWGFYQGSDWSWYLFISWRSSDQKATMAYHFDVDEQGKAIGTPRIHHWSN